MYPTREHAPTGALWARTRLLTRACGRQDAPPAVRQRARVSWPDATNDRAVGSAEACEGISDGDREATFVARSTGGLDR